MTDRFEVLFDATYGPAVRVARRIVGDPGTAEDVAAEALARAYARWGRVQRHPSPEAWVLRTATNLAIDVVRRKPPPIERAPATGEADRLADELAVHLALVAALATLSRRQREIVALRYLADLSEQDVADALSLSTGAVKTHLSRGLAHLRRRLAPDHPEALDALAAW